MKLYLLLPVLLVFTACGTMHNPPTFTAPSTRPIEQAHERIGKSQKETASHISKAKEIVKTLHLSLPEDQRKIDALTAELDGAQSALSDANAALSESEGARKAVDEQNLALVKRANVVSDTLRTIEPKLATVTHKYHRTKTILAGLASGFVALLLWKFKFLLAALGPYSPIAFIGGPAAAAALVWLLL